MAWNQTFNSRLTTSSLQKINLSLFLANVLIFQNFLICWNRRYRIEVSRNDKSIPSQSSYFDKEFKSFGSSKIIFCVHLKCDIL